MFSKFLGGDPDRLSTGEQIVSAIVAAIMATIAAGALVLLVMGSLLAVL